MGDSPARRVALVSRLVQGQRGDELEQARLFGGIDEVGPIGPARRQHRASLDAGAPKSDNWSARRPRADCAGRCALSPARRSGRGAGRIMRPQRLEFAMAEAARGERVDIAALNASAAFNRWAGFEVVRAGSRRGRAAPALARRARPVRRLPARGDDRRPDRHRLRLRGVHAGRPRAGVARVGELPGARGRRGLRRARTGRQGRSAPGVRARRAVRAARRGRKARGHRRRHPGAARRR